MTRYVHFHWGSRINISHSHLVCLLLNAGINSMSSIIFAEHKTKCDALAVMERLVESRWLKDSVSRRKIVTAGHITNSLFLNAPLLHPSGIKAVRCSPNAHGNGINQLFGLKADFTASTIEHHNVALCSDTHLDSWSTLLSPLTLL